MNTGFNEYAVQLKNLSMELPFDILTDTGTKQFMLGEKLIKIKSAFPPVIDPEGHYFKKVLVE